MGKTLSISFLLRDGQQRIRAKMRLYLAVAVLMLAFVAYTDAQEDTFEQKLKKFTDKITYLGRDAIEKAQTLANDFQNSEPVVTSKNWVSEQMQTIQASLGRLMEYTGPHLQP